MSLDCCLRKGAARREIKLFLVVCHGVVGVLLEVHSDKIISCQPHHYKAYDMRANEYVLVHPMFWNEVWQGPASMLPLFLSGFKLKKKIKKKS